MWSQWLQISPKDTSVVSGLQGPSVTVGEKAHLMGQGLTNLGDFKKKGIYPLKIDIYTTR